VVLLNMMNALGDGAGGHAALSNWYRANVKLKLVELEDHCEELREKCNHIYPEPGYKKKRRQL
jgi:hypothetical protein